MVCSTCGQVGHNKRTCSQTFSLAVVAREVIPCDYHDVLEEYEKIYESPPVLPALEVVAVVWEKWSVMSGDPMEMNLVMESEEVDISTEGFSWGDLPLDAVSIILDLVEKYNTEYHEDRVRMYHTFRDAPRGDDDSFRIYRSSCRHYYTSESRITRTAKMGFDEGVLEVAGDYQSASNWQKTTVDLRNVINQLEHRNRKLTPKNMKYKYCADYTNYHNRVTPWTEANRWRGWRSPYQGWYSWYHTLEQRESSIHEEERRLWER